MYISCLMISWVLSQFVEPFLFSFLSLFLLVSSYQYADEQCTVCLNHILQYMPEKEYLVSIRELLGEKSSGQNFQLFSSPPLRAFDLLFVLLVNPMPETTKSNISWKNIQSIPLVDSSMPFTVSVSIFSPIKQSSVDYPQFGVDDMVDQKIHVLLLNVFVSLFHKN